MDLSSNYFELFGLPVSYDVDVSALQPQWRQLQQQFHPDRVDNQDASAQRQAMQMSAQINSAYQTLKSPVLRAAYLLTLVNEPVDLERTTVADTDFLMAQMELREQLEDAVVIDEVEVIADEAQDWLMNLQREFAGDYSRQEWPEARETLRKMQFMTRLLEEVNERIEQLEDEAG